MITQRPPDITNVLDRNRHNGEPFVCAGGALSAPTGSQPAPTPAITCRAHVLHKAFGGNAQVLTDHTGSPVWTAPVEPPQPTTVTAARARTLPALYRAASLGLPTLADKSHTETGISIKVLAKNPTPRLRHQMARAG